MSKCIACLREAEVDSDGLCSNCAPTDPGMRQALLNLLKPTKEVQSTQENN